MADIDIFPEEYTTPSSRLEYCYKAQEDLRLLCAFMDNWWQMGDISKDSWQGLPPEMQAKYPYQAQITKEIFDQFKYEDYMSMSRNVCFALNTEKEKAKISSHLTTDFSKLGA